MSTKPIIGINADLRATSKNATPFSFISGSYPDSLIKAGATPVIIPLIDDQDDLAHLLDILDGIVMIGGADLDPRRDGYMMHPSNRLLDPRREVFDRSLIELVSQNRLPILGIGTGMQLINVHEGGTLYLHIPEDAPRALPHMDPLDSSHRHALEVSPDSMMERIYGEGEIRVNSMHHMSVDDVAPGFRATARCPDGIVEAIESVRDDWLAVGTQFHPENDSASALDLRVFEEFLAGVTGDVAEVRLVA